MSSLSPANVIKSNAAFLRDAWERQDASADRGEDIGTYDAEYLRLSLHVDEDGDVWFDGEWIASRSVGAADFSAALVGGRGRVNV